MRRIAGPVAAAGYLLILLTFGASGVQADDSWLDGEAIANWNRPAMEVPVAPEFGFADPRFVERARSAETVEDGQLLDMGWHLFAPYQAGWGIKVLQGTGSFDGMGRPWGYQAFVFVDGALAGTLAPDAMMSRADGALDRIVVGDHQSLFATFRRYAASDPLCCPSGTSEVQYRVERTEGGAVLVPVSIRTRVASGLE